ncbi:LysR family transcriptional regulator [Pedomonas sp. V897]|uniref:LysR family transcriptional regulator n=1 Tax=Pedomonas sp. V897 TaxID=3446482 RepID=UPI003EDEA9D5
MIHPSEFGALRAFVAVAEQRSFSRAAESLGISPSALSQTVRGLEERLGQRLLNRTTRSVSLTEAGAALLADVGGALATLAEAFDSVRQASREPGGTVRLHCFHSAARQFIAPILHDFTRGYPNIVLDLTIDDRVIDFVAEGFDAAIRIGEVIERDMVAIPLGREIRQIAVASPAYLAEHGTPATPRELLKHRCIQWRWPGQSTPYAWEFHENGRWFAVSVDGPVISSSRSFTIEAALAGVGIAFLEEKSVAAHLADRRLVALLEEWSAPFPGFYLCYPRQSVMPPALRALVDALKDRFRPVRGPAPKTVGQNPFDPSG